MSWVRVYVHYVFSTKNKTPFLFSKEIRESVHEHIAQNAKDKGIWLDCVNGYHDHLHCLVSLGKTQTISDIARLIKGESSFWINKNNLVKEKFSWQDDFWAVGVTGSHLSRVRNYIQMQEERHRNISFSKELDDFMKKYGWENIKV